MILKKFLFNIIKKFYHFLNSLFQVEHISTCKKSGISPFRNNIFNSFQQSSLSSSISFCKIKFKCNKFDKLPLHISNLPEQY